MIRNISHLGITMRFAGNSITVLQGDRELSDDEVQTVFGLDARTASPPRRLDPIAAFEQRVQQRMADDNASRADAIRAVVFDNPELHAAYLDAMAER
jgi:hypothetical protein